MKENFIGKKVEIIKSQNQTLIGLKGTLPIFYLQIKKQQIWQNILIHFQHSTLKIQLLKETKFKENHTKESKGVNKWKKTLAQEEEHSKEL